MNCSNTVKINEVLSLKKRMKAVLAKRLSALIKDHGVKRKDLAGMLYHKTDTISGTKVDTYSIEMINKWCSPNSDEFPSPEAMLQLSSVLGCSIDYLYGKEDCPTHENTDIHNLTGLSDKAINTLIKYKNDSEKPLPDNLYKSVNKARFHLERMNIDCINMILEHKEGSFNNSILVMIYQYVKSIDPDFYSHEEVNTYDNNGEIVHTEDQVTNLDYAISVSSPAMPIGYDIQLKEIYPTVFKDMLLRKIEEYRDQ